MCEGLESPKPLGKSTICSGLGVQSYCPSLGQLMLEVKHVLQNWGFSF